MPVAPSVRPGALAFPEQPRRSPDGGEDGRCIPIRRFGDGRSQLCLNRRRQIFVALPTLALATLMLWLTT
jgi:hypothetical protein